MKRSLLPLIAALCVALSPCCFADEAPASFAKWEKEIAAFEQHDRETPPPKHAIVFVGSSSIRKWTTLAEDFPHHRVLNRGFGGSELGDSAHFAERIVLAYEPRFIVVYAGGNDINNHKTAEQVFESFKAFVAAVRAKQPDTPIAYISIAGNPSRWSQVEEVKKANALIEQFTREQPNLKFIDVFHEMLGSDGLPRPEIFVADRLHMNAEGYKLWTQIVGRFLPEPDVK
ncbi:MAG TPA: SGNH/GDSL hydrolase family protein [Chthoniobacteraceae bacterium]|nr:SGNH/GDSL hydrolase family protein [Chthoniobacteraceae bacterium]